MPFNRHVFSPKILALAAAALPLACGVLAPQAATAQQTADGMIFNENYTDEYGNPYLASVQRSETRCQLSYAGGPVTSGFALIIGKDAQESIFVVLGPEKLGKSGDSFRLDLMVPRGWMPAGTTRYSVNEPQENQFTYETGALSARIDFETIKKAGYLRFQPNHREGGSITAPFSGDFRDKAVGEMEKCLASLPSYWSLDK